MSLRRKFEAAMGEDSVAAFDWSKVLYPPNYTSFVKEKDAVAVQPTDGRETYWILRTCLSSKTPVTPAASQTSMRGQAIPVHGGVVLDLTKMRGVKEVDPEAATATVLPGTTYADLTSTLIKRGLRPRVQPFRMAVSSVGGFIAEGGIGLGSLKYGTVACDILHLNFANPYIKLNRLYYSLGVYPEPTPFYRSELDPLVSSGGGKVCTYALGYNLKELLVGSEGTLGVITLVTIALKPTRGQQDAALYEYPNVDEAAASCRLTASNPAKPYVLALLNGEALKQLGVGGYAASSQSIHLLAVWDEEDGEKREALHKIHETTLAAKGRKAADDDASKTWKALLTGVAHTADPGKFSPCEEMKVPTSTIPQAFNAMAAAGEKHELTPAVVMLPYTAERSLLCAWTTIPRGGSEEANGFAAFAAEVRASLCSLGGSPYGVGLIDEQGSTNLSPGVASMVGNIKAQLDPSGIINPGKLLPAPVQRRRLIGPGKRQWR